MQLIKNKEFGGERPLYTAHDVELDQVTIHLGESSIKESGNIYAHDCRFEGKYVFWECRGFKVEKSYFAESARSSLWYSQNGTLTDCQVDAPKMFRRMKGINVSRCQFPNQRVLPFLATGTYHDAHCTHKDKGLEMHKMLY